MTRITATQLRNRAAATAVLAALWWLIAGGERGAWLVGLPAVLAAAAAGVSLVGRPPSRLSLAGLPGFITVFLRESLCGGVDVARRTLGRRLRIKPGFRTYPMVLSDPLARVLMVNCISLLPGTLAVDLDNDQVLLHLLDSDVDPEPDLLRLEQAIAGLVRPRPEVTDD
jgi:multicomponent Na+:H+ antiporter subunit E